MFSSLLYIILFYLLSIVGSIIVFPFSYYLFNNIKDRGYAFAKLFFFILLSFLVWFLSSATGTPYVFLNIVVVFLLMLLTSAILLKKDQKTFVSFYSENKKLLLFEELVFLVFFTVFILIRIGNPDLWHPVMGGEKPMDFAFINAIVKTNNLPPYDPWLAGNNINYYYFGHFISATLIKLLGIPSSFFYNIFLSYLFAQSAIGAFSFIYSCTKSKIGGILASFFLVAMGNLAQIPVIIKSIKTPPPINGWYWTATRVMPNSEINEFPFFTFLYADLHSHLYALPIALFFLLLCYELFRTFAFAKSILLAVFSGVVLGILHITNIWDFPTYTFIFFVFIFLKTFLKHKDTSFFRKFIVSICLLSIAVTTSLVVTIPFTANYITGPLGISFYKGPYTRTYDYLIIHGLFIFILVSYALFSLSSFSLKKIIWQKRLLLLAPICMVSFSIFLMNYFFLFLSILLLLLTIPFIIEENSKTEKFMIILSLLAIFLSAIPDLIDIKLGLGRMNTVFKFYFQTWILFALSTSYMLCKLIVKLKKQKIILTIWIILFFAIVLCSFSYIPTSAIAKVQDRMSKKNKISLDGEEYMKNSVYFDNGKQINLKYDYDAIQWIKLNINKPDVIVEANTPIYRWGSRISIYTGLPTILGWDWHEIAHRQYLSSQKIQEKADEIKKIYESYDYIQVSSILKKYDVKLIYLGQLEKIYYNTQGIENSIKTHPLNFKTVYSNPQTKIYLYQM